MGVWKHGKGCEYCGTSGEKCGSGEKEGRWESDGGVINIVAT